MNVLKLHRYAKLPVRQSPGAAGYDLFSVEDCFLPAHGGSCLVGTGIAISIHSPSTPIVARVSSRSGLSVRHNVEVGAGVIDQDFRGEIKVKLYNFGDKDVRLPKLSRIAQLLVQPILTPPVCEVDALDGTVRGASGFGSTGQQ
jgi:dUTP pyrophosphatase